VACTTEPKIRKKVKRKMYCFKTEFIEKLKVQNLDMASTSLVHYNHTALYISEVISPNDDYNIKKLILRTFLSNPMS